MLGASLTGKEVGVLGAPRAAFAVAWLVAGLVSGCGTVGGPTGQPVEPPPGPASAPPDGPAPTGSVLALDAPATAVVVDPHTATVAIALADPPRLLLGTLDGAAPARQMPLPGPATELGLVAEGGPLLVPVATPPALVQVPLDGGASSRTDLEDSPRSAVAVGERLVVALGDRLVVLDEDGMQRTVPGFVDATRLVPIGSKVVVLDQGNTAVSLVDPASGEVGPALRAGNGAVSAVADRFGRTLVTDVRDGELLVFAGDPLLLRQRWPVPGAPYGLAYDGTRDLAWLTLTARNEVVGFNVHGGEPVVVHRFPTVHQPDAVAVDPVSGRVVVVSASGAGMQVIDPERVVH
ncbi:MAG: YncE family protein [Pseudonocardiaceae bacterium]